MSVLFACSGSSMNGKAPPPSDGAAATAGRSASSGVGAAGDAGMIARAGSDATAAIGGSGPIAGVGAAAVGGSGESADAGHPLSGSGGTDAGEADSGGGAAPPLDEGPLFPANHAASICPDPPMRLHFSAAPTVANTGKLRVFKMSDSSAPVATVDFAATTSMANVGGAALTLARPVYIDGDDVIVRLPPHALTYGQTYYVTLDAGAVKAPDGTSVTISDDDAWQFSTRDKAPSDLSALRVALDGSGEFCSIQGALDALPTDNSAASVITIGVGTYYENIHVSGKSAFTLHGEDRKATIILGTNNNDLNGSTSTRPLVYIEKAKSVVIEDLTIHNLTPQGGSQAEALGMQACDQCVIRHADILSLQDTLLWSGRIYANDCYIAGNVDFVWGTGAAYFDHCEIKTVGR
ncbi:MAG TPA: pectinesterase family protein, partial [Polyangiales bacterium]|nr:pectinesterase family protein [Polyangiales bacterium]